MQIEKSLLPICAISISLKKYMDREAWRFVSEEYMNKYWDEFTVNHNCALHILNKFSLFSI